MPYDRPSNVFTATLEYLDEVAKDVSRLCYFSGETELLVTEVDSMS